jgi:hypothetical protein
VGLARRQRAGHLSGHAVATALATDLIRPIQSKLSAVSPGAVSLSLRLVTHRYSIVEAQAMIKRWAARTAVTAAFGATLVVGIASPAYAANTNVDLVYNDMLRGEMMHIDDGDYFRVYDWYKDGHGVRGTLQMRSPVTGTWIDLESKYNGSGSGTYVTFEHDVLSIYLYRLHACLVDGSGDTSPIHCDNQNFTE